MKQRKIPLRTCVGCGLIRPKREMVRLIIDDSSRVINDPTGKAKGRGAYLCRIASEIESVQQGLSFKEDTVITFDPECFEKATEKNAFSRAFKQKVKLVV